LSQPLLNINDPTDATLAPELRPPQESSFEHYSTRAALGGCIIWGVYLGLLWLFPQWRFWEVSVGILDVFFWPLVRILGRPCAVMVLAGGMAVVTMVAQRFLTDTRRLREVKRRTAVLNKMAHALPAHSPREEAIHAVVTHAHWRIVRAGLIPLGVLLGPTIIAFLWIPVRVDPSHINPVPGTTVTVSARTNGALVGPVQLSVDGQLIAAKDAPLVNHNISWPITLPAKSAIQTIRLVTPTTALEIELPTGDAAPPPLERDRESNQFSYTRPGGGGIELLTITCPDPRLAEECVFWQPFIWLGWSWDAGWVGLYLVMYLPAMYLARRLLHVP
jgi:uncharacterized membrane protein (DUF106 family)